MLYQQLRQLLDDSVCRSKSTVDVATLDERVARADDVPSYYSSSRMIQQHKERRRKARERKQNVLPKQLVEPKPLM